jgi:hypothetical protein
MKLEIGYFGAQRGKGITGWASSNLLIPYTDRYHYFLIGRFINYERGYLGDYEILESLGHKGITTGRLFDKYIDSGEDIEIYRITDSEVRKWGGFAYNEVSRLGETTYDWLQVGKLVFKLATSGKLPPWDVRDIEYSRDDRFICTEAANEGWYLTGYPVVAGTTFPAPSEFERALRTGKTEFCMSFNQNGKEYCAIDSLREVWESRLCVTT